METQVYGLLWALDITFPVTLSIVLVSNCTLQLQKERSCHVRRKKDFSIHQSISSSHIVLLQIILNLEAFTRFQCAEADIQRTDLHMCICASTDNWVWSPQFIQLPFAFTQITPGIYKCNRRDSRTIWTSSDNVHKIQLHRNSAACMSNLANFILIIQTNTGISTFSSLILFYLLSWILHLLFLFSLFHHIWLFSVGVHGDTLPSVHNACANFHISKMGSGILRSFPYVTDIIAY